MQETPKGSRLHIAIFGRRNAGKSSLINALTKQEVALVSDVPGTTTDPVAKAMEIPPIGPVVIIDTAGVDDVGQLGEMRVQRTKDVLSKADIAVLVIDATAELSQFELDFVTGIKDRDIPVIGVMNKSDMVIQPESSIPAYEEKTGLKFVIVSALTGQGIEELKSCIIEKAPSDWEGPPIIGDLIDKGDTVILVVPIDSAAPRGRLILPQVQTLRDIIDNDACGLIVKENQLAGSLALLRTPPKLVVTDSQIFKQVDQATPNDVALTSFSVLFARHKGDLATFAAGAKAIQALKPGDKVLIAEACTHHRQQDDIGTVKIPRWLNQAVGGELSYTWISGGQFPADLQQYKLVVHCGACMITRREMLNRLSVIRKSSVPIVNYGLLIAYLNGILDRALAPFPEIKQIISQ
ncbi:MAG: [FeFe] hydrogenase H-cluster maturation GTPase HydF [Veillonellaceae bacterium]|jgi:[FeFe] hydrogenase H-cluster maturation GTPase HydF|nr:[FeFe] hydrogenase H-cluster maturation GTPase HydF [Veillonellaceae bacterium]